MKEAEKRQSFLESDLPSFQDDTCYIQPHQNHFNAIIKYQHSSIFIKQSNISWYSNNFISYNLGPMKSKLFFSSCLELSKDILSSVNSVNLCTAHLSRYSWKNFNLTKENKKYQSKVIKMNQVNILLLATLQLKLKSSIFLEVTKKSSNLYNNRKYSPNILSNLSDSVVG